MLSRRKRRVSLPAAIVTGGTGGVIGTFVVLHLHLHLLVGLCVVVGISVLGNVVAQLLSRWA